ncbi:MAG: hypothetical protein ACLRSD_08845 [Oscillibacter sp.]
MQHAVDERRAQAEQQAGEIVRKAREDAAREHERVMEQAKGEISELMSAAAESWCSPASDAYDKFWTRRRSARTMAERTGAFRGRTALCRASVAGAGEAISGLPRRKVRRGTAYLARVMTTPTVSASRWARRSTTGARADA